MIKFSGPVCLHYFRELNLFFFGDEHHSYEGICRPHDSFLNEIYQLKFPIIEFFLEDDVYHEPHLDLIENYIDNIPVRSMPIDDIKYDLRLCGYNNFTVNNDMLVIPYPVDFRNIDRNHNFWLNKIIKKYISEHDHLPTKTEILNGYFFSYLINKMLRLKGLDKAEKAYIQDVKQLKNNALLYEIVIEVISHNLYYGINEYPHPNFKHRFEYNDYMYIHSLLMDLKAVNMILNRRNFPHPVIYYAGTNHILVISEVVEKYLDMKPKIFKSKRRCLSFSFE